MAINVNYEFLFVGRDENSFLENYVYDATDDYGDKGGKLWVTLEIQNNPAEAETIAETVFETMRRHFFADMNADPYARFENSLKEANKKLEAFKAEKSSHYIGNLSILAAAVVGTNLLLSQCGEAEAYLIRKRYVSVITEGLSDDNYEFFTNIATGVLELNDFVVLSSSRLLRYISKTELAKCITQGNVVKSLEELNSMVASEILGKIAITGINAAEQEEIMEEEVVRPSFIASKLGFLKKVPYIDKLPLDKLKNIDWEKFRSGAKNVIEKASTLQEKFMKPESLKDKVLIGFIAVAVILLLFVGVTKYRQSRNEELTALDTKLNQARDELSEALTKGEYDKTAAGKILAHAEQTAKEVLNTTMRAKATEVLTRIQEVRDTLDNTKRVTPEVYLDLTKTKSEVNALGILHLKDRSYVFDNNSLFELILNNVGEPMAIADNETVIAGAVFDERESLVFLTKSGKVVEFKDGNFRYMSTTDGVFHKGISIKTWSNKIYILNPEEDQIWKYAYMNTKDMFSNAEAYRQDGSMKNTVDFSLDGNIYTANSDGSLVRYYAGRIQETPMLKAAFRPLNSASKVYTDADMMQVFVLDGTENRLYLYQKEQKGAALSYGRQYQFDGVGEVRSLYFDKTANQIYIVDSEKIYKVTL
ncbi:hypothetical protein HZA39_03405 [Candidatus Peregrinibacteria bacterium]|nr:hypothetical protein [Candidatus Peregrinibacteria bacterium]